MAMQTGSKGGLNSSINVTPLVDVVLVLLIIFMVVTPLLQRGKDVVLPKAAEIDEDKRLDALTLSMTRDKRTWLDNTEVPEAQLSLALYREISQDPTRKVLLKADAELQVGDVRKVMDMAREAGAKGVSLGVEELKK